MPKAIDLSNRKFGKLIVQKQVRSHVTPSGTKIKRWLCLCDCGNTKTVRGAHLSNGATKSCGCLVLEVNSTHSMSKTLIYKVYVGIKQRCNNVKDINYPNYGGRGIKICYLWEVSPQNFFDWATRNGYKEGLTIERINNDKSYSPNNCKWATWEEQSVNKRISSNNSSGYTGISWVKDRGAWSSRVMHKGAYFRLGNFKSLESAVKARNSFISENNLSHKIQEFSYDKKAATCIECGILFNENAIFDDDYLNLNISGTHFDNALEGLLDQE